MVYVYGVLVGAIKEHSEIRVSDLTDVAGAIKRTLDCCSVGDTIMDLTNKIEAVGKIKRRSKEAAAHVINGNE